MKCVLSFGFLILSLASAVEPLLTNDIYSDILNEFSTEEAVTEEAQTNDSTDFIPTVATTTPESEIIFDDVGDNVSATESFPEEIFEFPVTVPPSIVESKENESLLPELTEKRSVALEKDDEPSFIDEFHNKDTSNANQAEFRVVEDTVQTSTEMFRIISSELMQHFDNRLKKVEEKINERLDDFHRQIHSVTIAVEKVENSLKNVDYDTKEVKTLVDESRNSNRETTRYLYTTAQLIRGDLEIFLENMNRTEDQLDRIQRTLNYQTYEPYNITSAAGKPIGETLNKIQMDMSVIADRNRFVADQCAELSNDFQTISRIIKGDLSRKLIEMTDDHKSGMLWLGSVLNASSTMLNDKLQVQDAVLQQLEGSFRSESEWTNRFLTLSMQASENLTAEVENLKSMTLHKINEKEYLNRFVQSVGYKIDEFSKEIKTVASECSSTTIPHFDILFTNISRLLEDLHRGASLWSSIGEKVNYDFKDIAIKLKDVSTYANDLNQVSSANGFTMSSMQAIIDDLKALASKINFDNTDMKHDIDYIRDLVMNNNEATQIQLQKIVALFKSISKLLEIYDRPAATQPEQVIHPILPPLHDPKPITVDTVNHIDKVLPPGSFSVFHGQTPKRDQETAEAINKPVPVSTPKNLQMHEVMDKMKFDIIEIIQCYDGKLPVEKAKKRMVRGTRVVPGRDWNPAWRYDGGGEGIITSPVDEDGHIRVRWERTGDERIFSMGYFGKYHLKLARSECDPRSHVVQFTSR